MTLASDEPVPRGELFAATAAPSPPALPAPPPALPAPPSPVPPPVPVLALVPRPVPPPDDDRVPELPFRHVGVTVYPSYLHKEKGWIPSWQGTHSFGTWPELVQDFREFAKEVPNKGQRGAFSTAILVSKSSGRADREVRCLGSIAVIDVDDGLAAVEHVRKKIEEHNVESFSFATYSNGLPGKGLRMKFVLHLTEAVPARKGKAFKRAILRMFAAPDGKIVADGSCVDLSRVHYMPGWAPGNERNYLFEDRPGVPLPVEDVYDVVAATGLATPSDGGAAPVSFNPEPIEGGELREKIATAFKGKHGAVATAVRKICICERFVRVRNGVAGEPPPKGGDGKGGSVDEFVRDIAWRVAHTNELWRYGPEALANWLEPSRGILEADDNDAGNASYSRTDIVQKFRSACEKVAGERAVADAFVARMAAAVATPAAALPVSGDPAWRSRLVTTKAGNPRAVLANAMHAFRWCPELAGKLAFNERRLTVVIKAPLPWDDCPDGRPWQDTDTTEAAAWLGSNFQLHVSTSMVHEVAVAVAARQSFDPFRDYLSGCVWDGNPRLDTWLVTYAGAGDTPYTRAVGSKWVISAVARAFKPGAKVDTMLILEGAQGAKKSSLLEALAGGAEFFADHMPDLSNKDAMIALQGPVILEMSELDALSKKGTTQIKGFLTSRVDKFRPPYGRIQAEFPRRLVLAGSTNDDTYLRDATGGRRFWSVRAPACDPNAIRRDRDQIWAEAHARYEQGETWWLDAEQEKLANAQQEMRREVSSWEELLGRALDNARPGPSLSGDGDYQVQGVAFPASAVRDGKVVEITQNQAHAIIEVPADRRNRGTEMRIAAAMKAMRWTKVRIGSGARRERVFRR